MNGGFSCQIAAKTRLVRYHFKLLYNMSKETWKNPFEFTSEALHCISTGVIPSYEAIANINNAKEKESAHQQFVTERLEERSISFFFPLYPI